MKCLIVIKSILKRRLKEVPNYMIISSALLYASNGKKYYKSNDLYAEIGILTAQRTLTKDTLFSKQDKAIFEKAIKDNDIKEVLGRDFEVIKHYTYYIILNKVHTVKDGNFVLQEVKILSIPFKNLIE